ncbi:hypothetical protein HanOQP8_Chr00c029g0717611 [Helianthus annuus]|nr:hypothetical protein HanOQP8_Chr00c029g0717611 [Helianthus annuus]
MFFKIKIITGTTGLLTTPDSVQGGSGAVTVKVVSELSHCFKPVSVVIIILKLK